MSEMLKKKAETFDAIVVSDYGYGAITGEMLKTLETCAAIRPVVIDARDLSRFRHVRPMAVKPNYREAARLLDVPEKRGNERMAQMVGYSDALLEKTGARYVFVTLDADGAVLFAHGEKPYRLSCVPEKDAMTIGAGDSFTSALALSLVAGAPPKRAARVASTAAYVVLQKAGTSACTAMELRAALKGNVKWLDSIDDLLLKVRQFRKDDKRIVFTNGCFDILHRGHVNFLKHARSLGDVLVVALNSDAGIRRVKGPGRPINSLADRIEVLAGLQSVDCLIAFDDDTPADVIRAVRPDIFVKGSAHTAESIPEAEFVGALGGQVHIIPAAGLSTSQLIRKIRQRSGSKGADEYRGVYRS
jgi:D-beta-D-heptose 7-phosphate kinase/D-beta-D-heptose 1-phosphate adenosyltransferase